MRTKLIVGKEYGFLTVMDVESVRRQRHYGTRIMATCMCRCGRITRVESYALRTGAISSCSCKRRGRALSHGETTGGRWSPEYRAWTAMITRCENPQFKDYKYYGGKGIRVCPRWRSSFSNFLADIGRKPSPKHSLDRKNGNRGYAPSNCRWATSREQWENRNDKRIKPHASN